MAKTGRAKNTKNKKEHSKLMARKKNKIRKEKELRKERLKALVAKQNLINQQENKDMEK